MKPTPSDFHLSFAGDDLRWAEERRPGFPILRWTDGTICEPATAYFGWSAETERVRMSSLGAEAYAIREWLAFLAGCGRRWDEADDLLLRRWRESHAGRIASGAVEARRVERKLACVFEFYRALPKAWPLDEAENLRAPFVGASGRPITSRIEVSPKGIAREVWAGAARVGKKQAKRPTPDGEQVARILAWLRAKADRRPSARTGAGAQAALIRESERNWLIGRCMVEGGLRAEETSDLSVEAIAKVLRSEGVLAPFAAGESPAAALECAGVTESGRAAVLDGLDALAARHRTSLFVEITGKGRKTRMAPFAIDLVRDLVAIGLWQVRRGQAEAWTRSDPKFRVPGNLFLSSKTKGRVSPGTVSDMMKEAFKSTGTEGSGHRLRAHYATATAARLWEEGFAMNGFRFDQTVVNLVLDRLAEALGHARPTTTIRHYLDMALLRHFGAGGKSRIAQAQRIWDAVVKRSGSLSEERMRLISKVVESLVGTPDGSAFEQVIAMALDDPELISKPMVNITKQRPRLVEG